MLQETAGVPRRYNFFILGLWQQPNRQTGAPVDWRIVLEDPHTAERSSFKDVTELTAFLNKWMTGLPPGETSVDNQ